jgi:tetratricopeptide (TPR) repeat protein
MIMQLSCRRALQPFRLLLLLTLFPPNLGRSQITSDYFSPGAAAVGRGYSGVVGIYDASALYWNPAALAVRRYPQATLSLHEAYAVNYLGYSHFIPRVGAFALAFSSADAQSSPVKQATLGWGFSPAADIYIGASISALEQTSERWGSLGIGFLFRPTSTRFHPRSSDQFFGSPWIVDRLTVGLSLNNLPLGRLQAHHQIRLGLSYRLSSAGPTVVYAHHFMSVEDTDHLGLYYSLFRRFMVYAGLQDLNMPRFALGGGVQLDNTTLQIAYDAGAERLIFTSSVRIGPTPRAAADDYYAKAKDALRHKDKRKAMRQAESALLYDDNHPKAADLFRVLTPLVRSENVKIDSLLRSAQTYESQQRFLNAAAQYLRVLKLDPANIKARTAINLIRTKVDIDSDRWYLLGVQYYDKGDFELAREIFESIILVKPDHYGSNSYLKKIDDYYLRLAEQHYFAGLGYYSQRKLDAAAEEFEKALNIIPEYQDASSYLIRIRQQKIQNQGYINALLFEAQAKERNGAWKSALLKYQEILAVQPDHAVALDKTVELKRRLDEYVGSNFERGVRAFQNGDHAKARSAFLTVLSMYPGHAGAKQYMAQLAPPSGDRSTTLVDRAQQYYDTGNYDMAVSLADSALKANPNLEQAFVIKSRALDQMDVEKLLLKAKVQYSDGNYLAALETLDQLLKQEPRHLEALELKENCQKGLNERMDDYFNRGIQLYTEEKYEEAIKMWDIVLRINPDHKGALDYKNKALERLEALQSLP